MREIDPIEQTESIVRDGGEVAADKPQEPKQLLPSRGEPFHLSPELRQHTRTPVELPVVVSGTDGTTGDSCTRDLSPGGMRIHTELAIPLGTPLALTLCFGNVCHLRLSGQVVFFRVVPDQPEALHDLGIAFCGIRDWEQIIVLSALKEVTENSQTRRQSLVEVHISEDALAVAAATLPREASRPTSHADAPPLLTETQTDRPPWERAHPPSPAPSRAPRPTPRPVLPEPSPTRDGGVLTFGLLVNGREVDTQLHRYSFFADKMITDRQGVLHMARELRRGHVPERLEDYVFARYCIADKDLNEEAVRAAHLASQQFSRVPLKRRLKIGADVHRLLLEHRERLIDLMVYEGHPRQLAEWEFFGMESGLRTPALKFSQRHLERLIARDGDESHYWLRKPDGVVCVSPPKNAPSSSSMIAILALLAGNTLVIKPPLQTPTSTLFLWTTLVNEALRRSGAPPGTLNLVLGNSEVIVDEWIRSPYVNDVLFIGDSDTGLKIGHRAYLHGKKPILELSGNDMMFVWADGDLDGAARSLLDAFFGSTQICMVPKKAFIHEDVYAAFEAKFLDLVTQLKIGLPSDPDVCLTPVIRIGKFYEFLADALQKGAELLCGGQRVNHRGLHDPSGHFITPAVIRITDLDKAADMRCIQEENFFPLIPLVKVTGRRTGGSRRDADILTAMIRIAQSNVYGLRMSMWVRSTRHQRQFVQQIHNSGAVRINCRHIGFSPWMATHGGTNKSGGPFGELNYVWQKTTHLQGVSVRRGTKRDE